MFRSFRTRLIVFVVGLVLLSQAGAFLLVDAANIRNATQQIARDLELGSGVFRRVIDERSAGLIGNARLLSGDFAFKQAFATADHGTILSAMENHLQRIEADVMVLLDPSGRIIADTLQGERHGVPGEWSALLARAGADDYGEASGFAMVGSRLHQITVVPLFTPHPSAWILFGFAIDDRFARDLGKISELSVMHRGADGWQAAASTLGEPAQRQLSRLLAGPLPAMERSITLTLDAQPYVTLLTPLGDAHEPDLLAVLQRSLAAELLPYENLRRYLVALFAGGLAISVIAAWLIARGVTRPVLDLATGVRRIAAGDYAGRVASGSQDEIGQLAEAFNGMASGLEERERVRSLLGKVVSPAIAEQLLSRPIELGGEEREVSVLFADVRDFTRLCEHTPPVDILALLNRYLSRVSSVIESNGGVVDKYVGDAVMALFGAPLAHPDHAERAVLAALAMRDAVVALNTELRAEGRPAIGIGIGVNTARVVAGNMGSESRMNYTVIGDGVNLASRLESLTRKLGITAIVSDATRRAAPGFVYREIDRVRVRGKTEAVTLWEPLGQSGVLDDASLARLEAYAAGRNAYLARQWATAAAHFTALAEQPPRDPLAALYAARCREFAAAAPPADWDGVYDYPEK